MKYNLIKFLKNKFLILNNFSSIDKSNNFKLIKTHKNNTAVMYCSKKKFYRKFSKTKSGIEKIKSEFSGINWFLRKIKKKNKKIILDYKVKDNFAFIDLKEIKGKKIKSWVPFEKNYKYLFKMVKFFNHYLAKEKKSHIHGDLTLDNIIFQNMNPYIIDWEFFGASKSFKGYDLAYLILSAVCLPHISNKKFSNQDEKLFCKLWNLLLNSKFNKAMLLNPFVFFRKKIKNDRILSKSYRLSKSKFFPFITDKDFQKKLLKIINSLNNEK